MFKGKCWINESSQLTCRHRLSWTNPLDRGTCPKRNDTPHGSCPTNGRGLRPPEEPPTEATGLFAPDIISTDLHWYSRHFWWKLPSSELMKSRILQRFPHVRLTCRAFFWWLLGPVMTQQSTRTFSFSSRATVSSPATWQNISLRNFKPSQKFP